MKRLLLPLLLATRVALAVDKAPAEVDPTPSPYYTVENIATPPGLSPEVGGLAFMPNGNLVACFHRGEIYTYNPKSNEWKLFAQGLHDPLGIVAPKDDEVIVMQRPELTRIRDTDGDGVADSYETICDSFGLSGNYHEFAFGPLAASDGGWFVALNVASEGAGVRQEMRGEYRERRREGRMYSVVPWRGWVVKITPDGKLTPWASGFRSPNGLGYDAEGRLFVTDNQGDWIGTSPLYHVEKGNFYGHPASLTWKPKETRPPLTIPIEELDQSRTRASVLFPHETMANSPTQPLTDITEGKFGPFAGQMLVGEMNHQRILRVAMEDIGGQMQGMAVPLLDGHGLRKGNNRFVFAPDGSLWVGQTDHGWPGEKGIQHITWTGTVPLDVKEMHLTKTGFDLVFTRPLDSASASRADTYQAQRYYYEYHRPYGSKQFELEKIMPKAVMVSEDRLRVTIEFDPLVAWRIYQFDLSALKSADGDYLANPLVVYTLNQLLGTTPPPPPPGTNQPKMPDAIKPQVAEEPKASEAKPEGDTKPATPAPVAEAEEKPAPTPKPTTPKPSTPKKAVDKPVVKKPAAATPTPTPAGAAKPGKATPGPRQGVKP